MNPKLILGTVLSVAAFGAIAGENVSAPSTGSFKSISATQSASYSQAAALASEILAKDAASRHAISQAVAPIRTRGDLDQYVYTHRQVPSPLDALSSDRRQMFLSSLTFNEKGITGFRYDVLESLTSTQTYKILSLFGAQGFTPRINNLRIVTPADNLIMSGPGAGTIGIGSDFLEGYRCRSKGTCEVHNMRACTSNC